MQLTASHRMDHLCWERLWPMRETKLTGVNSLILPLLSIFKSIASVATVSLPQASTQCFCPQDWLLIPGVSLFHLNFLYYQFSHHLPVMASTAAWRNIFLDFELFETFSRPTTVKISALIVWDLFGLQKSLLRSCWPAPVAPLSHSGFIIRPFFCRFSFQN